ncbi:sugar ABC transporter substrate-binding protein [Pseudolysinimonas sp.]|jgi:ribose transport system substrate-binding protein|uniref:sugar ABC transporter substrate-binding protein n=1 Tax=Pseudolysinimonas sp. TaxID=2680009 RepID=UPI0037837CA9
MNLSHPRRAAKRALIAAFAGVVLTLAGCSAPAPDVTDDVAGDVSAEVQANVDSAFAGTSGPLPESSPAVSPDHDVWVVSAFQQVSGLAKIAEEIQAGAEVLGWTAGVCDGQNDPGVWSTCIRQGVAAGADTLVLAGVDCGATKQALVEAKEAGVTVAGISAFDCSDPTQGGSESLFDVSVQYGEDFADVADYFTQVGKLRADYLISATGGTAQVLHVAFAGVAIGDYIAQGFTEELATCAGCSIVGTVTITPPDVPNLRTMFETGFLQATDATAVVTDLDFMLSLGVQQALEASDLGDVTVLGGECVVDTIAFMRAGGGVQACIGFSNGRAAWSLLDGINRFYNGEEPVPSTIGWQIYDASNESDWPAEGEPFEGPVDYREGYSALWAAAG